MNPHTWHTQRRSDGWLRTCILRRHVAHISYTSADAPGSEKQELEAVRDGRAAADPTLNGKQTPHADPNKRPMTIPDPRWSTNPPYVTRPWHAPGTPPVRLYISGFYVSSRLRFSNTNAYSPCVATPLSTPCSIPVLCFFRSLTSRSTLELSGGARCADGAARAAAARAQGRGGRRGRSGRNLGNT